jgi:hypothetical protein
MRRGADGGGTVRWHPLVKSREQRSCVHSGQDVPPERIEPARASTDRMREQPDSGPGPWVQHQLSGLLYSAAPKAAPDGCPRGRDMLKIRAEVFICVGGGGSSTQIHEKRVPARVSLRLSQGKAGRQAGRYSKLTADAQE